MSYPGTTTVTKYEVTSDVTSWSVFSGVSVPAGAIALAFVARDGSPTVTAAGSDTVWRRAANENNSTAGGGTLFIYENQTGSPVNKSLEVSFSSAQAATCILVIIEPSIAGNRVSLASAVRTHNANSTDANPAASSTVIAGAYRAGVFVAWDSIITPSAAPSGYTGLETNPATVAGGASGAWAYRDLELADAGSEDPGSFTSATENYAAFTLLLMDHDPDRADDFYAPFSGNGNAGVYLDTLTGWELFGGTTVLRTGSISSGLVHDAGSTSDPRFYLAPDPGDADQFAECVGLVASSNGRGLVVRVNSGDETGYYLRFQSGDLILIRIDTGNTLTTLATLGSTPQTAALGRTVVSTDVIRLEAIGNKLRVRVNGIQIGSEVTDANYLTGRPGLIHRTGNSVTSIWVDAFRSGRTEYLYRGPSARAVRYLGTETDAAMYLGRRRAVFP